MNDDEAATAVRTALQLGYRLVDTASRYGNETGVGRGIRDSGVPRSEIVVTTKLRGADHGYNATKAALHASLQRLGLEYVDLYLVHWPLPKQGRYVESYRAMLSLRGSGLVRSVGVSNFTKPTSNSWTRRRECCRRSTRSSCHRRPSGGVAHVSGEVRHRDPVVGPTGPQGRPAQGAPGPGLAQRYDKTPEQIILRLARPTGPGGDPEVQRPGPPESQPGSLRLRTENRGHVRMRALDEGMSGVINPDEYEEF